MSCATYFFSGIHNSARSSPFSREWQMSVAPRGSEYVGTWLGYVWNTTFCTGKSGISTVGCIFNSRLQKVRDVGMLCTVILLSISAKPLSNCTVAVAVWVCLESSWIGRILVYMFLLTSTEKSLRLHVPSRRVELGDRAIFQLLWRLCIYCVNNIIRRWDR